MHIDYNDILKDSLLFKKNYVLMKDKLNRLRFNVRDVLIWIKNINNKSKLIKKYYIYIII
jgi:hypothetical protein